MVLKATDELEQRDTKRFADFSDLDEIEAALAALVLADEGLRLAQPLGDVYLPQAALKPDISKQCSKAVVLLQSFQRPYANMPLMDIPNPDILNRLQQARD